MTSSQPRVRRNEWDSLLVPRLGTWQPHLSVSIVMPGATATEVGDNISDREWRKAIQAHVSRPGAVQPPEIADTVVFMLSMPRHVNISEISVRPTIDTTA